MEVLHGVHVALTCLVVESSLLEHWYLHFIRRISLQQWGSVETLGLNSNLIEYFKLETLLCTKSEMRVELDQARKDRVKVLVVFQLAGDQGAELFFQSGLSVAQLQLVDIPDS